MHIFYSRDGDQPSRTSIFLWNTTLVPMFPAHSLGGTGALRFCQTPCSSNALSSCTYSNLLSYGGPDGKKATCGEVGPIQASPTSPLHNSAANNTIIHNTQNNICVLPRGAIIDMFLRGFFYTRGVALFTNLKSAYRQREKFSRTKIPTTKRMKVH